ncbi:VOC family protein [Bacillus sp. SM2101]|uniref:VOC family protein n=1 Tax=Bacillus sp. SM2101 TaxID=2805366 RepID=UPI001BDE27BF|nr:VOC family protein [Bacillus sp. SM2101]
MMQVGSIFIPVTSIKEATKWYEKNLGVKKIDGWEDGAGFYFPNSSTQLALVQVEAPQPTEFIIKGKKKNVYFNFVVEDINSVFDHLHSNGVINTDIEDYGGMKGFEFFDLDNNTFSIVSESIDSPFHIENVKKVQKMNKKTLES